jgi:hypothetical protein
VGGWGGGATRALGLGEKGRDACPLRSPRPPLRHAAPDPPAPDKHTTSASPVPGTRSQCAKEQVLLRATAGRRSSSAAGITTTAARLSRDREARGRGAWMLVQTAWRRGPSGLELLGFDELQALASAHVGEFA